MTLQKDSTIKALKKTALKAIKKTALLKQLKRQHY